MLFKEGQLFVFETLLANLDSDLESNLSVLELLFLQNALMALMQCINAWYDAINMPV